MGWLRVKLSLGTGTTRSCSVYKDTFRCSGGDGGNHCLRPKQVPAPLPGSLRGADTEPAQGGWMQVEKGRCGR